MLDKLSDVIDTTIPDFEHKQDEQKGRLSNIKDKVIQLHISIYIVVSV